MDKPKWWELRKKQIQEAQEEVEDYNDDAESTDDEYEDVMEYGSAEDLRQDDDNTKDASFSESKTKESGEKKTNIGDSSLDIKHTETIDDDYAEVNKGEDFEETSNGATDLNSDEAVHTDFEEGDVAFEFDDIDISHSADKNVSDNFDDIPSTQSGTSGDVSEFDTKSAIVSPFISPATETPTPIVTGSNPLRAVQSVQDIEKVKVGLEITTNSEKPDVQKVANITTNTVNSNTSKQENTKKPDEFDFDDISAVDAIVHGDVLTEKKTESKVQIGSNADAVPTNEEKSAKQNDVPIKSTGSIDGDIKAMNIDMSGIQLSTVTASGDWPSGLEVEDDKKNDDISSLKLAEQPKGVDIPKVEGVEKTAASKIESKSTQVEFDDEFDDVSLEKHNVEIDHNLDDFDVEHDEHVDEGGGEHHNEEHHLDFDIDDNTTPVNHDHDDFDAKFDQINNKENGEEGQSAGVEPDNIENVEDGDDDNPEEHVFDEINQDEVSLDDAIMPVVESKKAKDKKPTDREIAKMLTEPSSDEDEGESTDGGAGFKNHTIHLRDYIIHHKTKVIIAACSVMFLFFVLYIMFVGVGTSSLPSFDDDRIVIKEAESINVRYGFGEKSSFHNAKMEFTLNSGAVVEIAGDFTISASMFSMFSKSMTQAHMSVKNAVINIRPKDDEQSVQGIVMQMIDSGYGVFADIKILNTRVNVYSAKGLKTDSFVLQEVMLQKMPDRVAVEGIIKVGIHRMNVSYSYKIDENLNMSNDEKNFYFSVKSHVFEFVAEGKKHSYGTVQKENRIEGSMEFVVRNPSQFTSILTNTDTLSKYMTGLQQFSVKGSFEYSSLGNLLRVKDGKVNVFNSLGDFEIMTVDAGRRYKMVLAFDSLAVGQLKDYFQSLNFLLEKETTAQAGQYASSDESDAIHLFSVIGLSKIMDIELSAKQITNDDRTLFKNMQSALVVTKDDVSLSSFKMNTDDATTVTVNGKFVNLGQRNPHGSFAVNMVGVEDGSGVMKNMLHFFSGVKLQKEIKGREASLSFNVTFKAPSIVFHDVSMSVKDVFLMEGMLQFTEQFSERFANVYQFRDISFIDADLAFFDTAILKFKQGDTAFQKMIGLRKASIEYLYQLYNAKLGENVIDYAKFLVKSENGMLIVGVDAVSEKYNFTGSAVSDIGDQNPVFKTSIAMQDVTDFTALHKSIITFFDKQYIFLPSLDKFNGTANVSVRNSVIFGEKIPSLFLRGRIVNGIVEFGEQKFTSESVDHQFSGKISGKIDMMKNTPVFTTSLSFVNLQTKEFRKVLPIDYEFEGLISGGGGFVFSGLSYTEFLNSLQMKAKFVLQKIKLPQLNLNFLAQHLLKTHGGASLFKFDKDYIESNFAQDAQTEANVVFSITGGQKKFTIDSCNIKTAYTAGVCAGNLAVIANNQISFEAIAKFAVPALDINKDLKDIMKLYVSSKAKYVSDEDKMKKQSDISSDLSQIYQYINYRRATFGI